MKPFEYVAVINSKKQNVMQNNDDPLIEKEYNPWLTNKSFSYYLDTVFLANNMNQYYNLPNKLQFDYLFCVVKKDKRYTKWNKSKKDKYRDLVKRYFDYGNKKADEALKLLSIDDLKEIEQYFFEGGIKKRKK